MGSSTSTFIQPQISGTLWQSCLDKLEHVLPQPTFEMCLRGSRAECCGPHTLQVTLPHVWAFDMLRSRQRQRVVETAQHLLRELAGSCWELVWAAPTREEEEEAAATEYDPEPISSRSAMGVSGHKEARGNASFREMDREPRVNTAESTASRSPTETQCIQTAHARPRQKAGENTAQTCRFTFDRLVTGPTNQMAVQAAREVGENPGRSFNPLVICGDVGLGKTHLMLAVKHHLDTLKPRMRTVYTSSETFTNELVDAFQERRVSAFRRKYRHVDLLLVDDVEFLIGKERIQEEFYHTFEELAASGRQLILSCDRPPHSLSHLQDRLCSRLSSGLVADIQAPTLDMRKKILLQRASEAGAHMTEEALEFVAENFSGSVRHLEGALVRVLAYADAVGERNLNLRVAQRALQAIMPARRTRTRVLTLSDVMEKVCHYYHIEYTDLVGARRDRRFSTPRHIAMYLAQELVSMRCREISEAFGNRDYSTVTHAIKKIAGLREQPNIKNDLKYLQALLGQ